MKQLGQTATVGSALTGLAGAFGARGVLDLVAFGPAVGTVVLRTTGTSTTGTSTTGGTQPGGGGSVIPNRASSSRAASVGWCLGRVTMSKGDEAPSRKVWASGRSVAGIRRCRQRCGVAPFWVIVTSSGRSQQTRAQSSWWLVAYYALLIALSWLGTFGGRAIVGHPWDTAAVALAGLLIYHWGARTGLPAHLLDLGSDDD